MLPEDYKIMIERRTLSHMETLKLIQDFMGKEVSFELRLLKIRS